MIIVATLAAKAQNHFPSTGNVGLGTTTPPKRLTLDLGSTRDGIYLFSDGDYSAYSDISFNIKNPASIPTGNVLNWVISHRKDGYFSGGGALSSLEFYGLRQGGGYVTPLIFKPTGDILIASAFNTARSGNVGIGLTAPSEKLHVNGNIMVGIGQYIGTAFSYQFPYDGKNQPHYGMQWTHDSWNTNGPTLWTAAYGGMKFFVAGSLKMVVNSAGNVGIGTTSPQAKLAVNGDIFSRKVKVTQAGWADFVFEPEYKLLPLHKVEQYIRKNKHLPDIPSAKEVEDSGLDLGEMNRKLLQKIEEQMLYIIELNKTVKAQGERIELLEKSKH
ncbi:hypothetical protein CCY01nite_52210 [Chitinophaga cymbidii]|uniref:Peptidase S74 domain-containing protein n=2 Tax=Chitinophaga cymbidii TaxID=1096750 RepID=A0A512RTD6_9BACT|nr:hypothetical protein CCY01nite_52210 [Chitinophaga cymbidii]